MDKQFFKEQLRYVSDFSRDAIQTIRIISLYSTRAPDIYDNMLTIRVSDDLLQSIIALQNLVINGIHNMAKRETRYMIETVVKYLIVDQEEQGQPLAVKTAYLGTSIPNSSIDVVTRMWTPFDPPTDQELKAEISDIFTKACAYVHTSPRQIQEQIGNYEKGQYIGFESGKMLGDMAKLLFRIYDILLTLLFIGFGPSMSKDLFVEVFNEDPKWKFHKGKYVKEYAALF